MNKEFKTINEIVNDQDFISNVHIEFGKLIQTRINRPEPSAGCKYKRDWYDRMNDLGLLDSRFFIKNITNVLEEKSCLSSELRKVFQHVCNIALLKTIECE